MAFHRGPRIVTDNLFLCVDAANRKSYAGTGTAITEMIRNTTDTGSFYNGAIYNSEFGGNFVFDGTNDYIAWAHDQVYPPTSPANNFTMEFWFRPTTTHQIDTEATSGFGGTSGQRYLFDAMFGGSVPVAGAGVSAGTNGISVYEHTADYLPALLVWEGTLSTTLFTHGVVTYTNKQTRLYVNGVLVRTGLTSTKTTIVPNLYEAGRGQYGNFPGRLALYRIYSRSLTATEVLQNFNALRTRFGL